MKDMASSCSVLDVAAFRPSLTTFKSKSVTAWQPETRTAKYTLTRRSKIEPNTFLARIQNAVNNRKPQQIGHCNRLLLHRSCMTHRERK
jgi:hypothetical protein